MQTETLKILKLLDDQITTQQDIILRGGILGDPIEVAAGYKAHVKNLTNLKTLRDNILAAVKASASEEGDELSPMPDHGQEQKS